MDRKHIVGLRLGILLFFAMLTVTVFNGYAETVYAISSTDEAELKNRILTFTYEPYDAETHYGIDISDMAIGRSEGYSIKSYINTINASRHQPIKSLLKNLLKNRTPSVE